MTIKEILRNDLPISFQCIEVNGEQYDEYKHGDLIHIFTTFDTYEEYNHTFNITLYRTKIKFTAIAKDKILKLLESEGVDTSLSDYIDKRINEISKE